jgi:hypothetical protein
MLDSFLLILIFIYILFCHVFDNDIRVATSGASNVELSVEH